MLRDFDIARSTEHRSALAKPKRLRCVAHLYCHLCFVYVIVNVKKFKASNIFGILVFFKHKIKSENVNIQMKPCPNSRPCLTISPPCPDKASVLISSLHLYLSHAACPLPCIPSFTLAGTVTEICDGSQIHNVPCRRWSVSRPN